MQAHLQLSVKHVIIAANHNELAICVTAFGLYILTCTRVLRLTSWVPLDGKLHGMGSLDRQRLRACNVQADHLQARERSQAGDVQSMQGATLGLAAAWPSSSHPAAS